MKKTEFSQYEEEVIRLRRHFHQYPELALQEFQTSAFIQKYLEELGYQVRHVPPTGLIAEHPCMKNREKMVVLRAEMDALPVQECTGLDYASRNEGCMHACGHDGILAVALILAKILSREKDFPVAVRFLFEPAEEIGEGTVRMLDGGALDKDKGRKADGFLMFHYACDQPLGMAVHKGQASAMIGKMEILIKGKSSHWCQAEKGIDSIYAAGLVVQKVHEISRDYVGKGPHVAGIGTIHGGEYPNIISDQVKLVGNIRACYREDFEQLKKALEQAFHKVEEVTGAQVCLSFPKDPVLPFANDPTFTAIAADTGRTIFGSHFLLEGEDELFLTGDNAYRYYQQTKGLFCVFLAAVPGEEHPFHHPKFQIDERILLPSVQTLYEIIRKYA
ncbi:M20 metallopeptidase family protein [Blautia glucerasea]|uniref:M20 metallopeptidase family protein n=1 Tax=Blautia glucerasea TaxID=536633 RepID=UPI00156F14B5|nr:M20 family metallopeptidase [Blautia glucerasea]NSJ25666.1 amidohydrolase [Blautia glucerasea]